jgi:hypothetical protein
MFAQFCRKEQSQAAASANLLARGSASEIPCWQLLQTKKHRLIPVISNTPDVHHMQAELPASIGWFSSAALPIHSCQPFGKYKRNKHFNHQ